ncbi:AAA family ATPase [Paracoccus jeotgali]|uniref:AAA+ ATPase domain-containing protein n=1 Tax=Paracoccus jeotgali TaxID=2065379 RepID=A0A2K9MBD0_9RHOB|nr:AAA family ATPase [Paracoccus jeotgali]AUM72930.1 hypothetical protein CYR75_00160 [Paracoccus jeotgali]
MGMHLDQFEDLLSGSPETTRPGALAGATGSKVSEEVTQPQTAMYHDVDGLLGGLSPLDAPLAVTRFSNVHAKRLSTDAMSLRTLAGVIRRMRADSKAALPLLKLATFGDKRTEKGSLRHDGNLGTIHGIEGDYDAGGVTASEAVQMLKAADIAALVYTTPSHKPDAPRWRVLVPTSAPVTPQERDALCARVNGALGGILANESFARSQSYYFGGIGSDPEVHLVEGRAIDTASDVPAIGKRGAVVADMFDDILGGDIPDRKGQGKCGKSWDVVLSALSHIPNDGAPGWMDFRDIGMALHEESDGSRKGFDAFCQWAKQNPSYSRVECAKIWRSLKAGRAGNTGGGTIMIRAKAFGWQEPDQYDDLDADFEDQPDAPAAKAKKPARLTFLTPAECDAAPARSYLIKGLIAEGDVGCIFGAPGAGKSLLAPALAYAVAQGREAFGMRCKAGGVFYVAAEDPHGMRGRVKALRLAHYDAPDFHLVEGVSNLLAVESPDLAALVAAVKERLPKLIVIDTLAMAFPGLEENSAEAMGRVVAVARKLTQWGAAVVLIHHDTKAEGATPRGHSLLNGALDVALHVKRDDSGVIRGKLTKNRNGTCDRDIAFRIAVEDGGKDEDGDAITLPRCEELDASSAPQAVKLTAAERAVLDVIHLSGGEVTEAELRPLCIDSRKVSSSDNPDSRRRVTDRALKGLVQKGSVIFQDGAYRIEDDHADDFDDLGEPDNPDSVRTNPGLSEMAKRRNPDGLGHTPLGVSDCPDDAGQGVL